MQDSDRIFLVAGMSQTQGVLLQKTQRKYLVGDPSPRLAWASWLRTCVTLIHFRCIMLSEFFDTVPSYVAVRRNPGWCRGCYGRSWCTTGTEENAQKCSIVKD